MALIAALAFALSQRLVGRQRAVYPTILTIASYALLVGGDAAVLRAATTPAQPNGQWNVSPEQAAIAQAVIHVGSWVDLGDGVTLRVLGLPDQSAPAQSSTSVELLVLELVYNDLRVLFTEAGEPVAASVHSQVTGVQGDAVLTTYTSTYTSTYTTTYTNRNVWRTAQAGRVHLYTDGQELWVEAEKNR